MAASDYIANVTFADANEVVRPGQRLELDATASGDDRWAAVIAAGWITATTTDGINEVDDVSNPGWTDPTP